MTDSNQIPINDKIDANSNEGGRSNKYIDNWVNFKKTEENSMLFNDKKNSDLDR